ncbi:MAG: hypothetical protein DRH04_02030 [Deltaproteobacteria bacterium]|nr:MAG: hypothetical protein DRH04_02030 [Deltaproteobacteria bacterium]
MSARIVKNQTNQVITIMDLGISVPPAGEVNLMEFCSLDDLATSNSLIKYLANQTLILNDGSRDFEPAQAIRLISGLSQVLPFKQKEEKLWVQTTARPLPEEGRTFYTVWTGTGDDFENETRSGPKGQPIAAEVQPDQDETHIDVDFFTASEPIYIHSGSFAWENAGWGDAISFDIVAKATPLVEVSGGSLVIEPDYRIRYVGSGNGTHEFGGTPVFVPNISGQGWWNLEDYTPVPVDGTGTYDFYPVEITVMRFLNRIPVYGTSYKPCNLVSYDSEPVPPNYKLRIILHNNSKTNWKFWGFVTIYRLLTYP